jgi:(E)-4-hydroxy-3-methylbut-2-enyl-diphosphate synthase
MRPRRARWRTSAASAALPLVADIHFDHRLALLAIAAGVDGLRLNPGNIGGVEKIREVVAAARERRIPIRVGVNSGSLEKDLLEPVRQHGTPEALVESALRHVALIEACGYDAIKISVKASDVPRTVEAYRLLAARTDYPLHLGVTEAGTRTAGTVFRSPRWPWVLLAEGIGDTIRVSLTDTPAQEVRVGFELLRCLGLRPPGASVISCPTCGRIPGRRGRRGRRGGGNSSAITRAHPRAPRPLVAVMGCMVNGPGEAREADMALAGGCGKFALYVNGAHARTVPESDAVAALLDEVQRWQGRPGQRILPH